MECVCFQVLSRLRRVTLRSCKAGVNHGLEQERVGLVMSGACLSRVDRSVELKAWTRSGRDDGGSVMRVDEVMSSVNFWMSMEAMRRKEREAGGFGGNGAMLKELNTGK